MVTSTPLSSHIAAARAEVACADRLCNAMTGFIAVSLTLLTPHLTNHHLVATRVWLTICCGLLVSALLVLLIGVMLPRLKPTESLFTDLAPDDIGELFANMPQVTMERHQCSELQALAETARRECQRLRVAVLFVAGAAVAVMPLAVVS